MTDNARVIAALLLIIGSSAVAGAIEAPRTDTDTNHTQETP